MRANTEQHRLAINPGQRCEAVKGELASIRTLESNHANTGTGVTRACVDVAPATTNHLIHQPHQRLASRGQRHAAPEDTPSRRRLSSRHRTDLATRHAVDAPEGASVPRRPRTSAAPGSKLMVPACASNARSAP